MPFTFVDLRDYQNDLADEAIEDIEDITEKRLITLYKLFSPEHLLKLPFANDSNTLDKAFYAELLHIVGLTEKKVGGKKLIVRQEEPDDASLIENAVVQLENLDKLSRLEQPADYGDNREDRLFNVALELAITWVNRVLFLKLLESQLLNYHKHQKNVRDDYAFLNAERALGRFLAQAEVVFEYRSSATSVEHQTRTEFREGFFLFKDDLWEEVNRRNDVQHIQEGMFIRDIPTFSEQVVREAILNAVSHRDYRLPGSVFTRQFPRDLQLLSPGGFPPGISEANILYRQAPRNRRVAEALTKCGLVERSGQGVDKMFRESILEGKSRPAYTGTDEYQVTLTVHGDIQNPKFVRFIEELSQEQSEAFSIQDLQALDLAYRSQAIPAELGDLSRLVDRGVLERVGRGRGTRYILSRRFYKYLDEKGTYTRKRGLDRETNKELLLRHIKDNSNEGSRFSDLKEVLPMLTRPQVQTLLRELKEEDKIHVEGATRGARWYPDNSRRIESQN